MNAGVRLWARSEWRRRRGSLALLALLVALGGGATVAAAAAARRTETAFDRLVHETRTPDLTVSGLTDGGFTDLDPAGIDRIERIDGVRGATSIAFMGVAAEEFPNFFGVAFVDERGDSMRSVWVDGGVDDVMAMGADEVIINEAMREQLGKGVGDRLRLHSVSPEQLVANFSGEGDIGAPAGPSADVRIVGVGRGVEDVTDRPDPLLLLPPAFYALHHETIGNCLCAFLINTDPDLTESIAARLAELFPAAGIEHAEDYAGRISDTVSLQRRGWWLIALTAAVAALAAVFQSCARLARNLRSIDDAQLVLGTTRRECTVGRFLVVLPAVLAGAAGAAAVAYALSPIAPIGLTSRAEPHPGLRWDGVTIIPGVAAVLALSIGIAGVTSAVVTRPRLLARPILIGRPVTSLGARLTLGAGRGAIVGVFLATVGVFGALTFQSSVDHLLATPALYGADFDAGVFIDDVGDRREIADVLVADPDIEAVALWWSPAGGQNTPVTVAGPAGRIAVDPLAFESVKGTITTLTHDGTAPGRPDEVAAGRAVMEAIGADVGDRIQATGPKGTVELTIVGESLDPGVDVSGGGFALTPDGLATLVQPGIEGSVVRAAPGVEVATLVDRYADRFMQPMLPPSEVGNIGQLGGLPDRVAQLLVVLGVAVLLNAMFLTVRAGRRELAIHRALGFTHRQVIGAHIVQGMITAVVGVATGVFVGFVAGRAIHRTLVLDVGASAHTVVPWQAWLVGLGALAACLCASGAAGALAARLRPQAALRAE